MTTTPDTTPHPTAEDMKRWLDQASGNATAARAHVATAAEGGHGPSELARIVNEIAEAEGAVYVYDMAVQIMGRAGYTAARDAVVRAIMLGADDRWSGRTNDAARARFDGMRDAATKVTDAY